MNVSSGTEELVAALLERHGTALRGYLRWLTGRREVAEELSQEVCLRIVRGADGYEARGRERAWVMRIARNVFVDYSKREARALPFAATEVEACASPVQAIRAGLNEALRQLDATGRDAFLLCELGGLRYNEIATTLGLTVAAVRSRIYRTRLALRATLTPPEPSVTAVPRRSKDYDE